MTAPVPPVPANAEELLARLLDLFPELEQFLATSFFAPRDGVYTPHALCSEFTDFYLKRIDDFTAPPVADFFAVVEAICAADPHDRDDLANALFTCFLENISCTEAGEAGRAVMGPVSRRFFDDWHKPPFR